MFSAEERNSNKCMEGCKNDIYHSFICRKVESRLRHRPYQTNSQNLCDYLKELNSERLRKFGIGIVYSNCFFRFTEQDDPQEKVTEGVSKEGVAEEAAIGNNVEGQAAAVEGKVRRETEALRSPPHKVI